MRKLVVFNKVTLDFYFSGVNGNLAWTDKDNKDEGWNRFVADNAFGNGNVPVRCEPAA